MAAPPDGQVRVRLAGAADDAGLRALAAGCPMDGPTTLAIEREPRFFTLNELQGRVWRVAVAEDGHGRAVGCGSIAIRSVYVGGRATLCAYAGDLRIAARARGGTVLARMHDLLVREARTLGAELAYTSIVDGNRAAGALVGARARLPLYRHVGAVQVCAVQRPASVGRHRWRIEAAAGDDLEEIAQLLDRWNRRHTFGPAWTAERLAAALHTTPGLQVGSFLVARDGDRMVGALAAWDQGAIQRTRIVAYQRRLAMVLRLYNAAARMRGIEPLPRPGELLRQLSVTHIAVTGDDPSVLAALLWHAWREHRAARPHALTFGLSEGHPLLAALRGSVGWSFRTNVYAIAERHTDWATRDLRGPVFHEISHL